MPRKSLSRRRSSRKRLSRKRGGSVTAILAGLGSFALGTSAGAGGMYLYKSRKQPSLPPSYGDFDGPPPPPPPYDDEEYSAPQAPGPIRYGVTPDLLQDAITKLKKSGTYGQVERTIQNLLNEAGMSTEAIGKKEACAMVNEAKANKKLNIQEANRLCDALYQCYDNNGRCDENGSLTRMGLIQPGKFGGGRKQNRRSRSRRSRSRSRSQRTRSRSTRTRRRRTQTKH